MSKIHQVKIFPMPPHIQYSGVQTSETKVETLRFIYLFIFI